MPHPALAGAHLPQHPPTWRTNLLTSSHQKQKLEQDPDSSSPAFFLVLFWSLFTFAGGKAEGFSCCLKLFWNPQHSRNCMFVRALPVRWKRAVTAMVMQRFWSCLLLFPPSALICHILTVLGIVPAWDRSNTGQHFSGMLPTLPVNRVLQSPPRPKWNGWRGTCFYLSLQLLYVMPMSYERIAIIDLWR